MTLGQPTHSFDEVAGPPRRGDVIVESHESFVEAVGVSVSKIVRLSGRRAKCVSAVASSRTVFRARDAALSERIGLFFEHNVGNWRVVRAGLRAIQNGNMQLFDCSDLMPELPRYRSVREFDTAWERLMRQARPADTIFTMNSHDLVSRTIAAIDHGSWSHCATYLQDGYILETITKPSGTHNNPIDRYRAQGVHVGLYRDQRLVDFSMARLTDIALNANIMGVTGSRLSGNKYDWIGALGAGVNAAFDVRWVTKNGIVAISPNGLIYRGDRFLVDHV